MLKKENRLRHTKDIENVWKNGKTIAGKLVFLKIIKNKKNISRFGFIVSSKISKKAVIRNKIKRQLREIIRHNLDKIKTGIDVTIIAKQEIINKEYQEIKNDFENLLQNI